MGQSYSVTAVLQAIDKNFSSTYQKAEAQAKALEKQTESVGGRSQQSSQKTKAAWAEVGTTMTSVGANMTKYVSVPIVAGFAAATKVGAEFEAQMSRVQAILGATPSDMKKLNSQAKQLGADTAFSAKEAADGMEQLASAGFNTNEVMEAMPGLLDLAAISGKDVGMASEYAASAVRQFQLDASNTGHVADVFARAAADTNAETKDMGYALKYAGTAANSAGWSLEETAASIGIMSNAGIKGEQAGTTLRGALVRLMKPTKAMYDVMERYGISIRDNNGKMYSMTELSGELQSKLGGLADHEKQHAIATLFGTEALSGMLALMDAGPDEIGKLTKSLENSDGSAKKMAKTMQDNLKGAIEEAGGSLETMAITIYEDLEPALTRIVKAFTGMINAFSGLPAPVRKVVVVFAAILAVTGPLLWALGKFTTFIIGIPTTIANTVKILSKLASAFKLLGGAIMAHPFVALAVAIAGLIIWLVHLYKTNEEFRNKVNACWDAVKKTVSESVEKFKKDLENIKKAFSEGWENVKKGAETAWKAIQNFPENAVKKCKEVWGETKEWFSNTWNGIKESATQAWEDIKQAISTKWEELKQGAKKLWDDFTAPIKAFAEKALEFFDPLVQGIMGAWEWLQLSLEGVWQGIQGAAANAWEILKSIVMGPVLFLCDLIAGNFDQLKEDMSMIWTTIKENAIMFWDNIKFALGQAWEGIKGVFRTVFNAIKTQAELIWIEIKFKAMEIWTDLKLWFSTTWNDIKTSAQNIWEGLKNWFKETWENIKTTAKNTWDSMKANIIDTAKNTVNGAKQKWQEFKDWLARTWENIKQGAINAWENMKQSVVDTCNRLVEGAKQAWENLKQSVSDTIDKVTGFFNRLGEIDLAEAGRKIIDGFLGGLKSAYKKVQDFVGGIADWIREHKGPISYDKRLLIPAGKAIMNGLLGGLESKFGAVQSFVKSVTACLSDTSVTNGIDSAINDVNPTMTIDKNTKTRVRHEIDGSNIQPAYISLSMGGQVYKTFVSDIFDEHENETDVRLDVF